VALARALAVEPSTLLLDEPFGALDAKVRAELREWLRRLHEEVHVTTLLVTHDQEEALSIADNIAVMDNAHIEQKNWTHVRKMLGYLRYDSPAALAALNDLYRHELRLFQNLFLPSVKLQRKDRVGARVRRRYDAPRTPLERVQQSPGHDRAKVAALLTLRDRLDPFALAAAVDHKIEAIFALANHRQSPTASAQCRPGPPPPPRRRLPSLRFGKAARLERRRLVTS